MTPEQSDEDLRAVHAGRRDDDAQVRRHRPGAGDRVALLPADGRRRVGRERSRTRARASPSACRSKWSTPATQPTLPAERRMTAYGATVHADDHGRRRQRAEPRCAVAAGSSAADIDVAARRRRRAGGRDRARREQPDLILMDLGLPGIDGWEATRQLKADPTTRHIPIIVLSAHAMTNDREHGARRRRRRLRHQAGAVPAAAREDRGAAADQPSMSRFD